MKKVLSVPCPHCLETQTIEEGNNECPSCGIAIPDGTIELAEEVLEYEIMVSLLREHAEFFQDVAGCQELAKHILDIAKIKGENYGL